MRWKITSLAVLDKPGSAILTEPGRRVVADQIAVSGKALPWLDVRPFALRAVEMAKSDLEAA